MTTDSQEKLVLGRSQSSALGLLLAPAKEAAQPRTDLEQSLVVRIPELAGHRSILSPGAPVATLVMDWTIVRFSTTRCPQDARPLTSFRNSGGGLVRMAPLG